MAESRYTKLERRKIYKAVYSRFGPGYNYQWGSGICHELRRAIVEVTGSYHFGEIDMRKHFPELWWFKPVNFRGGYWLRRDKDGYKVRRIMLLFAIEMLND